MDDIQSPLMGDKNHQAIQTTLKILRVYFIIAVLEGIFIFQSLLHIPTDAKNQLLWGFSALRLSIALGIFMAMLAFLWLSIETWRSHSWFLRLVTKLERRIRRQRVWAVAISLLLFVLFSGSYLLLLTPEISEPFTKAYLERLAPIALWASLLSAQTLIILPLLREGVRADHYLPKSKTFRWTLVIFGLILALWGWIAWSRTGLEADTIGWNALGTPVLETQVLLAWGAGLALLGLVAWQRRRRRKPFGVNPDLLMCVLLWLGASLYWWSIPLPGSWFVTEPTAPNFEYYPNSDALIYDTTGQSALVGEKFKSWDLPFPRRPMYALSLAFFNLVGNQKYDTVIFFQVALLALFPAILYLLTRKLSNRFTAVIMAMLVILREGNAIKLSGNLTISHSKLMMSDFPTAVGVALFTYLIVSWLQKGYSGRILPLISGGVLGTFMLIRPEVAILLLVVFGLTSLRWYHSPAFLTKKALVLAAGMALVLSPWIYRNWEMTGEIFLDTPNYRIDYFIERFNFSPGKSGSQNQEESAGLGETGLEKGEAMVGYQASSADKAGGSDEAWLEKAEAKQTSNAPAGIVEFIQAHYAHSQIQSILYLPASVRLVDSFIGFLGHHSPGQFLEECCSAKNYTRRLPYWDPDWDGNLLQQSILPVLLNLFLIALGLRVVWEKHRLAGLLPLGFSIAYFLINALARTSGGRYILAVDWVPMMYFTIGLGQLSLSGIKFLSGSHAPVDSNRGLDEDTEARLNAKSPRHAFKYLVVSAGFVLLGSLLPLTEKAIPPRYTESVKQEVLASLLTSQALGDFSESDLETFQAENGKVLTGRALYPRFYKPGKGAPGHPTTDTWAESAKPSFYSKDFPRFSFYLVGPENMSVLLPTEESPDVFPNASDVILLGCQGEEYFDAWKVAVFNPANDITAVLSRSPEVQALSCPFPDLE